jgi:hypothetical protein
LAFFLNLFFLFFREGCCPEAQPSLLHSAAFKYFFMKNLLVFSSIGLLFFSCQKQATQKPPTTAHGSFNYSSTNVNGVSISTNVYYATPTLPAIKIIFAKPLNTTTAASYISFTNTNSGSSVAANYSYQNSDSSLIIQPVSALGFITKYSVIISPSLHDATGDTLANKLAISFTTQIDSSDKFPQISDTALLTLVQQQTFNYFWAGADPTSGMAKERASGSTVTTGGSGFGVMAMLAAVQRNFITHAQALTRIKTIVNFLSTKCTTYHGAFSHWLNGSTGATIPFSAQDDGGDIVETSYMMQGLLCARQYFNSTTDTNETALRANINTLYNNVQWNWYRQNGQNVLTWNWSPDQGWVINVQVRGWSEALITYVLAASSSIDSNAIPTIVYTNGWAQNGAIKNGGSYFGIPLPLGPAYGGPLFFAHYSFLGINPNGLSDAYANYWTQDTAHANVNYQYCVANPLYQNGYSSACWGLTASDIQNGYTASSPTNDVGVIAPTAAISSLPYTPMQSMNAIRFFYYKLGNKIWGQYGFTDAFSLTNIWFDNDNLAIDQGPEIVMIENYRSGLLWNLFMSCPEVKKGMTNLGFTSPNL